MSVVLSVSITDQLSFCLLDGASSVDTVEDEKEEDTESDEKLFSFCLNDVFHEGEVCFKFCYDFGPPSAGSIYLFYATLIEKLAEKPKVRFYSIAGEPETTSNSVCLIGAFCVFYLNWSSEEVKKTLSPFLDFCRHYRDASTIKKPTYHLPVTSCFDALEKASALKFIDLNSFKYEEYTFYEQVENGDLNWIIPGKILAFCSPNNTKVVDDKDVVRHTPKHYVKLFKCFKVDTVVRLNKVEYEAKAFKSQGIRHFDLYFTDGTPPTVDIVHSFLEIAESSEVVAIHCKQGLGRTGTLIACYLMKHYGMTAPECIAFLRIQRPGSVVGPQQEFLHEVEELMLQYYKFKTKDNNAEPASQETPANPKSTPKKRRPRGTAVSIPLKSEPSPKRQKR